MASPILQGFNLKLALFDPASVFGRPNDVVGHPGFADSHHGWWVWPNLDPEDDCKDVDRASYGYVVHGRLGSGRTVDFISSASSTIALAAARRRAVPSPPGSTSTWNHNSLIRRALTRR
jgi:hypothetical protein